MERSAFLLYREGPRLVPMKADRPQILRSYQDEIGHCELTTSRKFISNRFWWPSLQGEINSYVRSCVACQQATTIPRYATSLSFALANLFSTFSIGFAGPFAPSNTGKRLPIVCVEDLTGCPLARAASHTTARVVRDFVTEQIMRPLVPPGTIVSDNTSWFTAKSIVSDTRPSGISWWTVLAYTAMSNGIAERLVDTLKTSIRKTVLEEDMDSAMAIPRAVFGYRRRSLRGSSSQFVLLYGVALRLPTADSLRVTKATEHDFTVGDP